MSGAPGRNLFQDGVLKACNTGLAGFGGGRCAGGDGIGNNSRNGGQKGFIRTGIGGNILKIGRGGAG